MGLDEADRLVDGGVPDPGLRGLGVLLDAARAPASARELAGESAAVAGFVAARRVTVPTETRRARRPARAALSAGTIALKVAAGAVVLATGGTALAAETGSLPDGAQQRAHRMFSSLGVPAPSPGPHPQRPGAGAGPSDGHLDGTPSPARSSAAPGTVEPLALCRAWADDRAEPRDKAMPPAARKALAAAAGGASRVTAYCTALLAPAPTTKVKPGRSTRSGPPTADGRVKTHPPAGP